MTAEAEVRALIAHPHRCEPDRLAALFAALAPVATSFLIGHWHGGELASGHPMDGALAKARWYGKSFQSVTNVQPLVCRDESGAKFSDIALGKGEASLAMVEFGGRSTASMIYDGQPVIDHFARVDEDTVMGVMTGKKLRAPYFYFWLGRDQ